MLLEPQNRSKRKILSPRPGIEPRSSDRPACSQSLYRLSYPYILSERSFEILFIGHMTLFLTERIKKYFLQKARGNEGFCNVGSISKNCHRHLIKLSRYSSVGIALGYGLDYRGSMFRFPVGARNFSLHHRVQNDSGACPAPYSMVSRGSFPGGKVAGAWSWPLTSI
jgi:hypothetical protein